MTLAADASTVTPFVEGVCVSVNEDVPHMDVRRDVSTSIWQLALSFSHSEALGCGLVIICHFPHDSSEELNKTFQPADFTASDLDS